MHIYSLSYAIVKDCGGVVVFMLGKKKKIAWLVLKVFMKVDMLELFPLDFFFLQIF